VDHQPFPTSILLYRNRRGAAGRGGDVVRPVPELAEPEHDREHRASDAERKLAGRDLGHAGKLGGRAWQISGRS
jgi:hypothetical protein